MTGAGELGTPDGEGLLTVATPVQDEVRVSDCTQTCQNRTSYNCMCCKA